MVISTPKKVVRFAVAIILFNVLLAFVYALHARYFQVDVVFYSAVHDALLAALACAIALWLIPYFKPLTTFERAQTVVIMLLGGYAFAISVPTVIDRSLSLYLLDRIERSGGGIRQDAMESVILKQYMSEYRVLDARLTEQLKSGTITIQNGCVLLTDKGRRISRWSDTFRTNFLPKHRLLMGSYTDALTTSLVDERDADHACR